MTRTCARTQRLIHVHLDDRLSQKQAEALQQHLGGCVACREELDSLLNLRSAIVSTDSVMDMAPETTPDPAELTEAIMRRVVAYEMHKAEAKAKKRAEREQWRGARPDFVPARFGWRS